MSVQNDFLAFAVGAGANVMGQADYAASTALSKGFVAGTARSNLLNKVWRQSSIMGAVLAQFIVARTNQPVIDDGTTGAILTNLLSSSAAQNGDAAQRFQVADATDPHDALNLGHANALFLPRVGEVRMWAGAPANIASVWGAGWYLADGANGTSDLRDRFIVGAGATYAEGATGGNASVTLTAAQMPLHNHDVNENPHHHDTTEAPHVHTTSIGRVGVVDTTYGQGNGPYNNDRADSYSTTAVKTGLTVNAATTGITTMNAGGGQSIDIRPPYFALCFVQYVGN
ncbi:hypothetical protein G3O00_01865 [Burkholderia sp. Ac-20384]|uniref:hypothetical protein n=1 Tax=Burkholderia sp. Ac-20384 TaxID=2703902 RepID=UPI00197F2FEA|nr:hypothetical protein [Burkholderia sp. Ac-20384]MBN3822363.1 hypothetical protein [Burkholderia sp. Ac-20384]